MARSKEELIRYWEETGTVTDKAALKAFGEVPREKFIREEYKTEAYGDYPLPIAASQTISQPTTVMIMTQALELKKGHKVLEIGAGSGYQAAVIAKIVYPGRVFSVEVISDLCLFAKHNLKKTKIKNVKVICADGSEGWPEEAPYDRIIVTAACPKMPQPLIGQLKEGGIIVAPIGSAWQQRMIKGTKKKGKLVEQSLGDFVFVPLVGKHGFD